ncbi:NUDIX domain-containing protein [Streptomyces pseudovenezuelae]|uniref:NUDIX hydrolase n=1 Tax=Streptomyces pseudovenezuelae TaxID=67350 RepID=UPI0036F04E7D
MAAAVIIRSRRRLVVSKTAAPDVFYLPGGCPDPGEDLETALLRELREELGFIPVAWSPRREVRALAALERVPMTMTVYDTTITGVPRPAAELAAMRWITRRESTPTLAPALRDNVPPHLRSRDLLG